MKRVRGSYDVVPSSTEYWNNSDLWDLCELKATESASRHGFTRVRLPIFEYTDTFTKHVGDGSDVNKEMYTFNDKGNRSITLRPEFTTSLLRAYVENRMDQKSENAFYYIDPCWRYERPQKGRYRQFYQFGGELIGNNTIYADIEIVTIVVEFLKSLGIDFKIIVNSVGNFETREKFAQKLREYFSPYLQNLSTLSQIRYKNNPLRILDSKEEIDQKISEKAPKITDYLPSKYLNDLEKTVEIVQDYAKIQIDYSLVRGLDYYEGTVFEVVSTKGEQILGGGGRYDNLLKRMGGPNKSGTGFSLGIERVLQSMETQITPKEIDYYLIPLLDSALSISFKYMQSIRENGFSCKLHVDNFNLTKGIKAGLLQNAKQIIIIGEEEIENNYVRVKNLTTKIEKKLSKVEDLF